MDPAAFLAKVGEYRSNGWRLMLINATSVLPVAGAEKGAYEVSWSFEKDGAVEHLREKLEQDEEVPSISNLFGPAFLYENEMRDLFGVKVTGIAVDFGGELYRTAEKVPFSPRAIQARLSAKGKK